MDFMYLFFFEGVVWGHFSLASFLASGSVRLTRTEATAAAASEAAPGVEVRWGAEVLFTTSWVWFSCLFCLGVEVKSTGFASDDFLNILVLLNRPWVFFEGFLSYSQQWCLEEGGASRALIISPVFFSAETSGHSTPFCLSLQTSQALGGYPSSMAPKVGRFVGQRKKLVIFEDESFRVFGRLISLSHFFQKQTYPQERRHFVFVWSLFF